MDLICKYINKFLYLYILVFFAVTPINTAKATFINASYFNNINHQILNNKVNGTKVADNNRKNDNTTIHTKNSIKNIWEEIDGLLNVSVELIDNKQEVKIIIYNMLGKEMRKIFEGIPNEKNEEGYYIFTSDTPVNLPKNIYILVIQGLTFKIADKFVVTK